ncbi:MAG: hypothetical protein WC831_03485 [Parcubacteria group bacterium]
MKKKTKNNRVSLRPIFWLGVLTLGLLIGISIQFTRAWVEPSATAPDGNVAAPINTGANEQVKTGTASQKADICVDAHGTGDKKCLSDLVSFPACTLAGGIPSTVGSATICKFAGASCPSGWSQYLNYTETTANTCTGAGNCATSVTTGHHAFANIDPATEAGTYQDCTSSWNSCCYTTYSCPPGVWHPIGSWCGASPECHGCGGTSSTLKTCMPNINFVGCTSN